MSSRADRKKDCGWGQPPLPALSCSHRLPAPQVRWWPVRVEATVPLNPTAHRAVATALGCALEQASKASPLRVRERGVTPPHWQKGFFDHVLRSQESAGEKWKYVRENPVRAGLVAIPAIRDISAKFLLWTIAWSVCDVRAGVL